MGEREAATNRRGQRVGGLEHTSLNNRGRCGVWFGWRAIFELRNVRSAGDGDDDGEILAFVAEEVVEFPSQVASFDADNVVLRGVVVGRSLVNGTSDVLLPQRFRLGRRKRSLTDEAQEFPQLRRTLKRATREHFFEGLAFLFRRCELTGKTSACTT